MNILKFQKVDFDVTSDDKESVLFNKTTINNAVSSNLLVNHIDIID